MPEACSLHPAQHLRVGLLHPAEVPPEAVLVKPLACLLVPEAAGVRGDLIGEHQPAVPGPAYLYLEVHERDAPLVEEGRQDGVDPEAELLAELEVLVRDAELAEVVPVEERVA